MAWQGLKSFNAEVACRCLNTITVFCARVVFGASSMSSMQSHADLEAAKRAALFKLAAVKRGRDGSSQRELTGASHFTGQAVVGEQEDVGLPV
jgi:hypothetical protein